MLTTAVEISEKQCRVCKEYYPPSSFQLRNPTTGRRDNRCNACRAAEERLRSQKRRENMDPVVAYSPVDPWMYLARAILKQADADWEHANSYQRRSMTKFYQSFWFDDLCDLAGYNPDVIREKLGIG